MRRPLGIAIVGGLIVSQALTLYTTPVIYLYMDGLSDWTAHMRKRLIGLFSERQEPVSPRGVEVNPRAAKIAVRGGAVGTAKLSPGTEH